MLGQSKTIEPPSGGDNKVFTRTQTAQVIPVVAEDNDLSQSQVINMTFVPDYDDTSVNAQDLA